MPCAAGKKAIVVYGKQVGTKLTVCTDKNCPVHDPKAAAEQAVNPAPVMASAPATETEAEREEREAEYEQRRKEHEEERQRREEEGKQRFKREQKECEAERARREALVKARQATFEHIVENAPAMFTASQLRVFLHALINLDPYDFAEDVAAYFAGDDENNQQTPEDVLASTHTSLADEKLTSFALRLALTGHTDVPRGGDVDFPCGSRKRLLNCKTEEKTGRKGAYGEAKQTQTTCYKVPIQERGAEESRLVTPPAIESALPTILDGPAAILLTYPRETVVEEKFEAMVKLGIANTRMKDFHDLYTLSRGFPFEGQVLAKAITRTFERRKTQLPSASPIAFMANSFEDESKRQQWDGFNRKNRLHIEPVPLRTVAGEIEQFVMPLIRGVATNGTWTRAWNLAALGKNDR